VLSVEKVAQTCFIAESRGSSHSLFVLDKQYGSLCASPAEEKALGGVVCQPRVVLSILDSDDRSTTMTVTSLAPFMNILIFSAN
jgi:hypothetical protein